MKIIAYVLGGLVLLVLLAGLGLWLAYRAPDIPLETLKRDYGRPNSAYADIGGGIRIHYLDGGRKDGRPVVLIHGFGDNSFSWDGWTKVLGATHRVLAVDLPGHGLTDAPADYVASPDRLADSIAAWAKKIGLGPAAVAGNSLGGATAWLLAVRHPEQVRALILVDAAGWPMPPAKGPPPLAFRIMKYKLGRDIIASIDSTPLIREGLRGEVGDPKVITDPFIARWAALQCAPGHRAILMSLGGGSTPASDAVLANIKVPTLILWGEADPLITVPAAHKFNAAIKGSELKIYPGVGHLPMTEIPEQSATDAAAFLARHPQP